MSDEELTQAMAELQEVVRCHCDEAYRDRGLKDPYCECDSAEAVKVVADRIRALTKERDAAIKLAELIRKYAGMGMNPSTDLQHMASDLLAMLKGESHA